MADTIFRLTNSGDTEANVDTTEKIIFNTGTIPDSTGRLVRPSFRMASDLNPHPNPDTKLNPIQDSLLGVVEVTVAGYFIDHNNTLGPRNLYNWSIDEDVNNDFQFGRFGLSLSTMNGILNVVPTTGLNGTGYMLAEVDIIDLDNPRTKVGFIAKFLRNGAITTISGKSVSKINITNNGSDYTSVPSVLIDSPTSGVTATAIANISGEEVTSINITNPGSGYTSVPSVTITGGGGSLAAADAVLG